MMSPVELSYRLDGPEHGKPVVLGGSLGSDVRMWDPQVADLAEAGYRVVRFDLRGHGCSPAPAGPYTLAMLGADVLLLLDHLGISRANYVGLSLGGMVGMWLAQHAAHRIRTLTLCCTSAALGPAAGWAERARVVENKGVQAISQSIVDRWFTLGWRTANPERTRFYADMIAATPAQGYAGCCAAIATMDIAAGLSTICAPTLVIAGADDPATPPSHGERIAAAVRSAQLKVISPGAHLATVESSRPVNDLVIAHLKEHA